MTHLNPEKYLFMPDCHNSPEGNRVLSEQPQVTLKPMTQVPSAAADMTSGQQRRYPRAMLRRVAFSRVSQRAGIPLRLIRSAGPRPWPRRAG